MTRALIAVWVCPVIAIGQAQASDPAQPSLQQSFDAASDAAIKGDCATALPLLARLAADPRLTPGSLPAATIAVRRGVCLASAHQDASAKDQLQAGLTTLRTSGPDMAIDTAKGEEALGDIAARQKDHDAAVARYLAAVALVSEPARPPLLVKLAEVTQFDGDRKAVGYADDALSIVRKNAAPDKEALAAILTVRGRILMSLGDNGAAFADLKQALALSGGLTRTMSFAELSMRGDLAEAALLNGDKASAQFYLANTGTGLLAQSPFSDANFITSPACGPTTGLKPDDMAIVEFGIDAHGAVPMARTVYTRGNYAIAVAFERAVEQWRWHPEDLARIPPAARMLSRVELRCTESGNLTSAARARLDKRFLSWAEPLLAGLDPSISLRPIGLDALAARANQRESEGDLPGAIAALAMRGGVNFRDRAQAVKDYDHALELASKAHLDDAVLNALLVYRATAMRDRDRLAGSRADALPRSEDLISTHPALAGDALATDTLLLETIAPVPAAAQRQAASAALTRVAEDDRLPKDDMLRHIALLRLARIAAPGNPDAAHYYRDRSGLVGIECADLDVQPAMTSDGMGNESFPDIARSYGFEGLVHVEFDIGDDGKPARVRPVIAYPPFVFVDAALRVARNFRYQVSNPGSLGMACTASNQALRFRIGSQAAPAPFPLVP